MIVVITTNYKIELLWVMSIMIIVVGRVVRSMIIDGKSIVKSALVIYDMSMGIYATSIIDEITPYRSYSSELNHFK